MKKYDPKELEPKWQKIWAETDLYKTDDRSSKPKWYQLEFFPYPSGSTMHVGHVRNYVISDAFGRYKRMTNHSVLHPMGWDAFGLPAENHAIKTGTPPRQSTEANIEVFKRQLTQMGLSYDWSREINSSEPDYYRWTQSFFLMFYRLGLAYRDEALVNWCPNDKTVLANEQVIRKGDKSVCERCGHEIEKRELAQWFFRITKYADRLLEDLESLDWPESIKAMQRNWIGRSVGAEIDFKVEGHNEKITVFTTRADTLFGATFMVLAPEHRLVEKITTDEKRAAVTKYVKSAEVKSEVERQETKRPKTGQFTGSYAINPATGDKIPIWVADYVLGGYGTGAIMAVPAHDERDYEFARAHELPIKQVLQPISIDTVNPPKEGAEQTTRNVAQCVVYDPKTKKYLTLKWKKFPWHTLITGGIEADEDEVEGAQREIVEETGYKNLKFVGRLPFSINSRFYAAHKKVNRNITMNVMKFELVDQEKQPDKRSQLEDFDIVWVDREGLGKLSPVTELPMILRWLDEGDYVYTGEGRIINSDQFDLSESAEARDKMTSQFGKEKLHYKMRDWLVSRQRYWGAPIPIIYCGKCGVVPVPEDSLPVELPELASYQPSDDGRSPLAKATDWRNVKCPKCDGPAERETDTMDTFVDSSWYFLRFTDPHNQSEPFSQQAVAKWMPVDNYVGGAEHAVAHLLFARFWTKVLHDEGLVEVREPFRQLRNQGMIGGSDGRKMSKRYGNAVTPDEVIEQGYGADSLRLYELFIGPYDQGLDWNPNGIDGTKRFLNRTWALVQEHLSARGVEAQGSVSSTDEALETAVSAAVHKTLKKVTLDLEQFGFNTAIAAMMECVNELYKLKVRLPVGSANWGDNLKVLVQMLAPFAPHIGEELWEQLGGESSVHVSGWPAFDPNLARDELVTIAIQVNGKLRGQIEVPADLDEDFIKEQAADNAQVKRHLGDKKVVKTIYVPHKLVNFVIS